MKGLAIFFLVVAVIWFVTPFIFRWAKRKATERLEDYLRAQFGLPPRQKEKKGRKNKKKATNSSSSDTSGRRAPKREGPIIPKEYAEDVEFIEIRDYSESEIRIHTRKNTKIYHESQVSDADWVEIKKSGSK